MRALLLAAILGSVPLAGAAHASSGERRAESLPLASAAGPSTGSVALPAVGLLALSVAAFALARRKRGVLGHRVIQIVETASLGPRRSLVVARVGEEVLVLGVSEAGVCLLRSRLSDELPAPSAATPTDDSSARARPASSRRPDGEFSALFAESVEDLELRRKLQHGSAGYTR